ncbi:MAG: pyridoxamine 5'-phosphate oxidase family protein [Haloferacaceae archaeon]
MAEFARPAAFGETPASGGTDGVAMSDAEIDDFLSEQGTGVLSLTSRGDAYAIPESFGYDEGTLYFLLADHDDSRKMAYLERTTTVCFVAYELSSVDDWASVVVRGELTPTPDDAHETAAAALASNAVIPGNGMFGHSADEPSFEWYELDPTERSGLRAPDR